MTNLTSDHVDQFGRDFLKLALSIDRHFPGYVDAYYGPVEIKAAVESADPAPLPELRSLLANLEVVVPSDNATRAAYLQATLRAMACSLDLLAGTTVGYLDEVRRIYDIEPMLVDETVFEAAHAALDTTLPPAAGQTVAERLERHRRLFEIDTSHALSLIELARAETRARTLTHITLPQGEAVDVTLTQDHPWSAYNWYLGGYRSHIEFNTDMPLSAAALASTFAHEGYPGHHTEAILKEQGLARELGYAEQMIMLLHSPSAVIAEGIATSALEMIFGDGSHHAWNTEVLFPAAGLSGEALEAAEQLPAIDKAVRQGRRVSTNAAILYHSGRLTREQTIDYILTFGLSTPQRAERSFGFLSHPLYRSYVFTYTVGYDLIDRQPDKGAAFRRLLTSQVLPSELATTQT